MSETTAIAEITQLPVLNVNFEAMREQLGRELAEYDILVTQETLPGAKKLATVLNKRATDIDTIRKAKVKQISAPIAEADSQLKELVLMVKDGRQKILDQVATFEDQTRELAEHLLGNVRRSLWTKFEVHEEFRRAQFNDLIKLTSVTASGSLAKSARDALEARVRDDKAMQDRTEMRLLQLENRCYKAGLTVPLRREHVDHFLNEPDESYDQRLESLISREVEREHEAARIRQEREQRAAAVPADQQHAEAPAAPPAAPEPEPQPEAPTPVAPEGRVAWLVMAEFHVSTPPHVQAQQVEERLRALLQKAEMADSLADIKVRRA